MSGSVLVARELPADALTVLEAAGDVDVHRGPQLDPAALVTRLQGKDALVCQLTQRIDAALLDGAPDLKIVANVAVGYGVAVVTQLLIFPVFGLHTTLAQNLKMGAIFTIVSIARSFALRRVFEAIRMRGAK